MTVFRTNSSQTAFITSAIVDSFVGYSLIIAMLASLIFNPLVIFYHATKRKSVAKLLFILLGVSDLTTLFLTPIINSCSFLSPEQDSIEERAPWYKHIATWNSEIAVQYSAFLTSVLSFTRYVSIAKPFYQINMIMLKSLLALWFLYLIVFRIAAKVYESHYLLCHFVWDPFAQLVIPHVICPKLIDNAYYKWMYVVNATILQRGIWMIVSLFSLLFTLIQLSRRPGRSKSKKSEITVIILTTAYLLTFIPMIVENILWLSNSSILAGNGYYLYYIMVTYPGQLLSVINPLIIIFRSSELQKYIVRCFTNPFKERNIRHDTSIALTHLNRYGLTYPGGYWLKSKGGVHSVASPALSMRDQLRFINTRSANVSPLSSPRTTPPIRTKVPLNKVLTLR